MRSSRVTPYVLLLSLFAALVVSSGPSAGAAASERVKGSFIVKLKPGASGAAIARKYGGQVAFDYSDLHSFAFSGPDGAAAKLARDPGVAAVSADYVVHAVDDAPLPKASHLQVTDSIAAKDFGYDGNTATQRALIAIVDTGVDRHHPFFQAHSNVISGGDGRCVRARNGTDQNGHGTATASNAAGRVGSAHEAAIYSVRVFPGTGTSTTWGKVICGLNRVKKYNVAHPAEADDIDVVNMSIAGPGTAALRDAVEALIATGVVVVAAAGNNNGGTVQAPARYPGVISVSALNHSGTQFASFSARNALMAAPGSKIYGADDGGRISRRTGTSRSSPQVAGAVAVLLAIDPAMTSPAILSELQMSGRCPGGAQQGAGTCGNWPNGGGSDEPLLDTYCAAAGIDAVNTDAVKCPATP